MQEFPPFLISPSSFVSPKIPTILVDSREACLAEAGELVAARIAPESLIEIGDVVDADGNKLADFERFRLRQEGRSLYKSVGIGGMDVAIATIVVSVAEKLGLGSHVVF